MTHQGLALDRRSGAEDTRFVAVDDGIKQRVVFDSDIPPPPAEVDEENPQGPAGRGSETENIGTTRGGER